MATIIVVTSGKGGVGKTTTAAAFGTGLALAGKKTAVIDFDVGLRNLDLIMGCERRVVYDLIDVINGDAKLNQALIKDKRVDALHMLPTSQTRDKDALTLEGIERIMNELKETFDYVVCDSPAGIEHGAQTALYTPTRRSSSPTPRCPRCATATAWSGFSPASRAAPSAMRSRSSRRC